MQEKSIQGIKGWKEDDRPREKCLLHGISALSDAELIAILIGSGTKEKSAVALGREILRGADDTLSALMRMSCKQLRSFDGIGPAKAVTLMAAFEIGRRRSAEKPDKHLTVRSSRQAAEIFVPMLSDVRYEECWLLMLNSKYRVLGKVMVASGGVNETIVDPKHVFNEALSHLATAIVLCHNHPGGSVMPSEDDIKLTRTIQSGAKALGIQLLDHIIVGAGGYYSFADSRII